MLTKKNCLSLEVKPQHQKDVKKTHSKEGPLKKHKCWFFKRQFMNNLQVHESVHMYKGRSISLCTSLAISAKIVQLKKKNCRYLESLEYTLERSDFHVCVRRIYLTNMQQLKLNIFICNWLQGLWTNWHSFCSLILTPPKIRKVFLPLQATFS